MDESIHTEHLFAFAATLTLQSEWVYIEYIVIETVHVVS